MLHPGPEPIAARDACVRRSMRESRPVATIATIGGARRLWAVGAIHGDLVRLTAVHGELDRRLRPGDAIVYLGNYLGRGDAAVETVTELLAFRRRVLARPPLWFPGDIVYLRGSQEEMWQKLLQLQFAGDAVAVLDWMLSRGVDATLTSYGGDIAEARRNAAAGTMALNRWTRRLREMVRDYPGHDSFMAALMRAVVADGLLFVNSGIDPRRPFTAQGDAFWWGGRGFDEIQAPYEDFRKIIRGYDPAHRGFADTAHSMTLDGGCGYGGSLVAVCVAPDGTELDRLEA